MTSNVSFVKNGIKIQCDTSRYPAPRPKAIWPLPLFPCAESSLLSLTLAAVSGQAISAIQIQSTGVLPGSAKAVWVLLHQCYQGTPAVLPQAETLPVSLVAGAINLTLPLPMAGATHNFWLQKTEGVQTVTYPLSTITTPVDPASTLNALTAQDQAAVLSQWAQVWNLKTYLDADGIALGISSAAYDAAIATMFNQLVLVATGSVGTWSGTGALPTPSWVTLWPLTTVVAYTSIKTLLGTWLGSIATAQATLQKALTAAAAFSVTPCAIGDGVTASYLFGASPIKVAGVVKVLTTDYTLASGVLTFLVIPPLGALIQGASTNAQAGVAGIINGTTAIGGGNLVLNSSFEVDSNADGLADLFNAYNNSAGLEPATYSLVAGLIGSWAQRVSWAVNNTSTKGFSITTAAHGFAWQPNTPYILSFYAKASGTNIGQILRIYFSVNQPTKIDYLSNPVLSAAWQRYSFRINWGALVDAYAYISLPNASGTQGTLDFDGIQAEQGAIPTAWSLNPQDALTAANVANAGVNTINSPNALAPADEMQLVAEFAEELSAMYGIGGTILVPISGSLLAQATAAGISSVDAKVVAYTAAVQALYNGIVAAGGPGAVWSGTTACPGSSWFTTWGATPATLNSASIAANLQTWWTNIANTAMVLQSAISQVPITGVNQINSAAVVAPVDQISIMQLWNAEAQIQTALNAAVTALAVAAVTTLYTTYATALTTLSTYLTGISAGWAGAWPLAVPVTGSMTTIAADWAAIAAARKALENGIVNNAQTGVNQLNATNYFTPLEQALWAQAFSQESAVQGTLWTLAAQYHLSHAAYDSALTNMTTGINTALSTTCASWPLATTLGPVAGIAATIQTYWNAVALQRTLLQLAINNAAGLGVQGSVKNLSISTTGLSAGVNITFDYATLLNTSFASGPVTISIPGTGVSGLSMTTAGANGLDTGTVAASTWYSIWLIWANIAGTPACLASLSATAPTLPSGYTHAARVGWIRTDGTVNKYPIRMTQRGNVGTWACATGTNLVNKPVIGNGALGTWATVWGTPSITALVPPTASRIRLLIPQQSNASSACAVAPTNAYPLPGAFGTLCSNYQGAGGLNAVLHQEMALENTSTIAVCSQSNSWVNCDGWVDEI